MGQASSAKINQDILNKTSLEVANKTMMSTVLSTNVYTDNTQQVTFKNIKCGGDLNVGNIEQEIVQKIDINSALESVTQSDIDAMLEVFVDSSATLVKDTDQGFGSTSASVEDQEIETNIKNELKAELKNEITIDEVNDIMATAFNFQNVGVEEIDVAGDCNFKGVTQNIGVAIATSNIADKMVSNTVDFLEKKEIDVDDEAKSELTQEGIDEAIESAGEAGKKLIDSAGEAGKKMIDSAGDAISDSIFNAMLPFVAVFIFIMFIIVAVVAVIYIQSRGSNSSAPRM